MKSFETIESPLLLFGPRGGGKTSKLINWLVATPADSKLKVFLCANRLARHQVGLALDKITNGNLLGYNVITYYELIARITGRREWGSIDRSDFFEPSFLQGLNFWLNSEVGAIVLDQTEALNEAALSLLKTMPASIKWAMGHSSPDSLREEISSQLSATLLSHFHWVGKINRTESSLLELLFDDSEQFWNELELWLKRELPDFGFDPNRAWSRVIILGSDLGVIENKLKQMILSRFKFSYPDIWVSGLSKDRIPQSTALLVVREYEGYSVDSKSRLVIRGPNFNNKTELHDFPIVPILKGQQVTADFIQSMSVKELNKFELYFDGRRVFANEISIYGAIDDWRVEIIDGCSYRLISPFRLKWHKSSDGNSIQKNDRKFSIKYSANEECDPVAEGRPESRSSKSFRKLQSIDEKLLATMTVREFSKMSLRYKGKEAKVIDVNFDGPNANWWLEIMIDSGRFRVHPNELTFK